MAVDDSYTKLLLHFNGSDNGTTFTDEAGATVTRYSDGSSDRSVTKIGTKKFGTASYYTYDTAGEDRNYLTVPNNADYNFSGDFCVDCWIYPVSYAWNLGGNYLSAIVGNENTNMGWVLYIQGTSSSWTQAHFYDYTANTGYIFTNTFSNNTWYHIAVTRSGSSLRCFVDGTQIGTTQTCSATLTSTEVLRIGRIKNVSYPFPFYGYIDELRISKGVPRWTTTFNVPTSEYVGLYTRKPIYINTGIPTEFGSIDSLAVANGGTGALTASDARTNLGLAIGSDVAAYSHTHTGTYTPLVSSTTDHAVVRFNGTGGELQSITALTVLDNGQIVSTLAVGTKPLDVTSTTVCTNLNADTVDGKHNTDFVAIGLHTIWIPAAAMYARTTNGAASGTAEMSTNKNMFKTLDFDTSTAEYAQFAIQMPKSWDEGTVTAAFVWSHAATTTIFGVAFGLQGVAISNDDAGDVAFGTAQLAVDTGGTTNDIYVSPTTSAITIAGTPAANDYVMFQVYRAVSDNGDTMGIDARLHGVQIYYTIDAGTDS